MVLQVSKEGFVHIQAKIIQSQNLRENPNKAFRDTFPGMFE